MKPIQTGGGGAWPALPIDEWRDTCATLHMMTQIVGKVRLAQAPHVNHWWQVPLYVTPTGLTTSSMPHGVRAFQIDFDFVAHRLLIRASGGEEKTLELAPRPVADFYTEFSAALSSLWFTVEFGVVREGGAVKAYGTGLLSSAGELEAMSRAELRPLDLEEAARADYDPTSFQPALFCADSFDEMEARLRDFLVGWRAGA